MNKLEAVDRDALQETLTSATDPKAVKRLMIALAHEDAVPVETLSDRYGIARSTIYFWLDRFEESSIADAIYDEHRPGRPPLLNEHEREQLAEMLQQPSKGVGLEQTSWRPELAREYVQREYGVSYSLGHACRLLRD
jgi:transposase